MKTAIVWGASGGIGRATVKHLVEEGWGVAAVSRHPDDLADLTPHRFLADVVDPSAVAAAWQGAASALGPLELSVYAAGDIQLAPVAAQAPEEWRRILDANLNGAFVVAHFAAPHVTEDAHLFFIGAPPANLRVPGLGAYAAAKTGLEVFAELLAKEQPAWRVSVVRPGPVNTPLWDKVPFRLPPTAAPPMRVARRVLEAHREGHRGLLDM